jgi:hypothetical protein
MQAEASQDPEKILTRMRPEPTENNHISHSPAVYLFQCKACGDHFILSDEE